MSAKRVSRRHFLSSSAAAVAACAIPGSLRTGERAATPIGIQLYTVRALMARDVRGTLEALREIGYAEVELAGLHRLATSEWKSMLDDLGLRAPASHVGLADLRARLSRVLEETQGIGAQWVVCPWIDAADRTPEGYRRLAGEFNRVGEAAKDAGLGFAYHNHQFEFDDLGAGQRGYDILLAKCDPDLVAMELDLYWITAAGRDPLRYLTAHPGRFPMVHVKDRSADGRMVNVGRGTMDFGAVIARAGKAGIRHWFVEHDEPPAPLQDARESFAALRRLLPERPE